jgi:hypothetical protein
MFIAFVVVSAYSDIPQLEPIRKQIESFKLQNFMKNPAHFERTTIEDIITNPEKYIGENVTIEGTLDEYLTPQKTEGGRYVKYYLFDEQNFRIGLVSPLPYQESRIYSWGGTYRVKGKVVYLKVSYMPLWPPRPITEMVLALEPIEMIK